MKLRLIGVLSVSLFLLTSCALSISAEGQASDGQTRAQNKVAGAPAKHAPSKKQLTQLIASAKTAEGHFRLAARYREEAQSLKDKKNEHIEMGAEYDKNPQKYPTKPSPGRHCRDLAGYYSQAEKRALELAQMHDDLAKSLSR